MEGPMGYSDETDESLMRAIKGGKHQAFSILVRRHTDRFFKTAYRLCGQVQEAEDMVQNAFLKIWNNPSIWKEEKGAKFTTWFYRILINQNIDRMRAKKPVAVDDVYLHSFADDRTTPEAAFLEAREQELIEQALRALPERQRTAITLCFYEEQSNAQAAQIMGVKVKALESLLMRAKAGLKVFMQENAKRQKNEEVRHGT